MKMLDYGRAQLVKAKHGSAMTIMNQTARDDTNKFLKVEVPNRSGGSSGRNSRDKAHRNPFNNRKQMDSHALYLRGQEESILTSLG